MKFNKVYKREHE